MFREIRGQLVHTAQFGSGGRTVVGVSGAFGTWEIWHQPFEILSRRHRVIAYDHFGTGVTRVPDAMVTFADQVAVLSGLLDACEVDRCVLAADSNMVAVAVEVAATHRDRIDALALVSGGVVHEPTPMITDFVASLRREFDAAVDAFVQFCIPEDGSDHLRVWLGEIIHRTGGERAARLLESFYGVDVSHRLAELAVPTVAIHGDQDFLPASNLEAARQMVDQIPDGELVVLEGVGHVPTLTRPAEVAEVVERLADRVSG